MLDFQAVRDNRRTMQELVAGLSPADLRNLTNEMVDRQLDLIAGCVDADVTFVPEDPDAYDAAASSEDELYISWTLGHVIVHTTASSEEAAAIAAELARGVPHRGGRSRSEVPWRTVTTTEQCRRRLEESRRMRLASLDMWPAEPHLDNTYRYSKDGEPINAIRRFVGGLSHDDSHLAHLAEIVRQARAARAGAAAS